MMNARFTEASPLAWDEASLDECVRFLRAWVDGVNSGIAAEDDFAYKYLYDPNEKLALGGRILFFFTQSDTLFTTLDESMINLDFRWLSRDGSIPVYSEMPFFGIYRKSRAKKAAAAFAAWFFTGETQRLLLEAQKRYRIGAVFGISGGLSTLKEVTESVYPRFFPGFLGHLPPEHDMILPGVLPLDWHVLKERVLMPFLRKKIRAAPEQASKLSLEQAVSEWARLGASGGR
jgi:hypothetical protein